MWSCAVKRGGRIGLSKLGSSRIPGSSSSWRALSASTSPPDKGSLDLPTKPYPSFWSTLKKQKHGLGNMALSASIAFLALSIIRQEKELTLANESAGQLRQENEVLKERLENVKSLFVKSETGESTTVDVLQVLRDALDVNNDGLVQSPVETEKQAQSPSRSKFMV